MVSFRMRWVPLAAIVIGIARTSPHAGAADSSMITADGSSTVYPITEAVAEPPGTEIERKLADTVRMLRNTFIDRRLAALTAQLGQPELTGEQFTQIETEKTYLRRWKAEPLRPKADT